MGILSGRLANVADKKVTPFAPSKMSINTLPVLDNPEALCDSSITTTLFWAYFLTNFPLGDNANNSPVVLLKTPVLI